MKREFMCEYVMGFKEGYIASEIKWIQKDGCFREASGVVEC